MIKAAQKIAHAKRSSKTTGHQTVMTSEKYEKIIDQENNKLDAMPNNKQYIKNNTKIVFIMAWFMCLFILDTTIIFLVGRIVHSSNHDLLIPVLIYTLILLAQIPIQWKALRNWFPSERRFYDVLIVLITVIMALVGLYMIIVAMIFYFLFSGLHEG